MPFRSHWKFPKHFSRSHRDINRGNSVWVMIFSKKNTKTKVIVSYYNVWRMFAASLNVFDRVMGSVLFKMQSVACECYWHHSTVPFSVLDWLSWCSSFCPKRRIDRWRILNFIFPIIIPRKSWIEPSSTIFII